jgi:hypothetical protein
MGLANARSPGRNLPLTGQTDCLLTVCVRHLTLGSVGQHFCHLRLCVGPTQVLNLHSNVGAISAYTISYGLDNTSLFCVVVCVQNLNQWQQLHSLSGLVGSGTSMLNWL